jgi:hypothetical protein
MDTMEWCHAVRRLAAIWIRFLLTLLKLSPYSEGSCDLGSGEEWVRTTTLVAWGRALEDRFSSRGTSILNADYPKICRNRRTSGGTIQAHAANTQSSRPLRSQEQGHSFSGGFPALLPRLGYQSAIWAVAHRLCRLVWKILHEGVRYIEQGNSCQPKLLTSRAQFLAKQLRKFGYDLRVTVTNPQMHESVS